MLDKVNWLNLLKEAIIWKKKSFLIGLFSEFIIIIAFIITKNEEIFIYGSGITLAVSFGLGMILSGFMSGNIYRRTAVEDKEERNKRLDRTSALILLGIPSLIALIVYYLF